MAVWVLFCVFCNFTGWILSAADQLNRAGYAAAFAIGLAVFFFWKAKTGAMLLRPQDFGKLRRRFRRPFPLAFLILAALAILGGVIYPPSNYDALAYRLPRVLHWLAADHWHWIHTDFERVNRRGPGMEWVAAPLIAFLRTDRLLFLFSAISFLLLPGLIFSVLTRLGVRGRVAWCWMWPLSCGYCFLLQAGGIANDLFTVPLVLAAFDYALRSHQQKSLRALWLSILAAGMFTGVKSNTVPLGLPYVIALAPGWRLWFRKVHITAAVCIVAVIVSFVPIAYFNLKYSHDWTGGVSERMPGTESSFSDRLIGNAIILGMNSVEPPVAPFADWWNRRISAPLAQKEFWKKVTANFLTAEPVFNMTEMATEEDAGLGLGCSLLLVLTAIAVLRTSRNRVFDRVTPLTLWFIGGTGITFLVFMTTSFVEAGPRLLTPYYPLLVFPLLVVASPEIVRRKWWRATAMAGFGLAVLPLLLSPPRPLFPWRLTLETLQKTGCPQRFIARAETVYSVYNRRADGFAPMKSLLPPGTKLVGMVTYDDPEAALWWPYGSLRVIHVCHDDSGAFLRSEGLKYVLVSSQKFGLDFAVPFEEWLKQIDGTVMNTVALPLRAGDGPSDWYLVRLN